MTILNLMLGKKRGGLEQAAFDYAEALAAAGISAITVISPGAWVEAPLVASARPHESLPNVAAWDPLAALRLRRLAARANATAILCHGNRALSLALRAFRHRASAPRIIAVAHNYKTKRFHRADACFAITHHLATHLAAGGARNISIIPHAVSVPGEIQRPALRTPPVIGAMGRFDAVKGFDVFVEALAVLASRGVGFHAILGGDGPLRPALETLIAHHGLQAHVSLCGWVKDKSAFFESVDFFVVPSRLEAFGLALVEAMAHGVPVITSDAPGPRAIVHPGVDALLTPRGDANAIADAVIRLLENPAAAQTMGVAGHSLIAREYTRDAMATRLQTALADYTHVSNVLHTWVS